MSLKVAASHMVEEHGCDEYWRMRIRLVTESSRTQGWRENTVAHMSCGECGFRVCNRRYMWLRG